jgi:hypothetical protein
VTLEQDVDFLFCLSTHLTSVIIRLRLGGCPNTLNFRNNEAMAGRGGGTMDNKGSRLGRCERSLTVASTESSKLHMFAPLQQFVAVHRPPSRCFDFLGKEKCS